VTIVPIPADDAGWRALRLKHVGGSEVAALFGLQRAYQHSAFTLWQIKSGRISDPGEHPSEEDIERIQWGNILEPIIAAEAAKRWDWEIEKGGYATDDSCAGLGATLDYVITNHREEDPRCIGPGLMEVKNVDGFEHARSWGNDDVPPFHIMLQPQHQFAATGFAWGAVVPLVGGNRLGTWRCFPRPRIIAEIRAKVFDFWCSVHMGRPPATDGTDSTAAALRAMYPELRGEITFNDEALWHIFEAFMLAREERRDAALREQAAKSAIIAAAAGHQRIIVEPFASDAHGWRGNIAKNHRLSVREISGT
jgi:predicted phage-related endonuclease